MKTIAVSASKSYCVYIGSGILSSLGTRLHSLKKAGKVCIVSDSNVWPLYGRVCEESLKAANFSVIHFVFPAGEESKNGETYLKLLNFLAENKLSRSDTLIALGGGVVGDLTGFAAATYLRGVDYVQIPTTVLAAVDSSVGGKTAIDLPVGKNLCGAFWQPILVLCDTATLDTLPEDIFRDGCAEVIKYGILYDAVLFAHLEEAGVNFDRETVISRCVELKRDVVAMDEFDTGERMKLNLGHTFGHGIESASNYRISHGKAVAIGTAMVARASHCPDTMRIIRCLEQFGLPVNTDFTAKEICAAALSDKKRSGDTIRLILPLSIGNCVISPSPVDNILAFIEEGL